MKKRALALVIMILATISIVACSYNKKNEETKESNKEKEIDMEYEGTYEFPEYLSVAHCINCDEEYRHYGWDYEEEIKMSDVKDKAYSFVAFSKDGIDYSYPMIINGKEIDRVFVGMKDVPENVKKTAYEDYKVKYSYEDDEVAIIIQESKKIQLCEGIIYDKTKSFTNIIGNECVGVTMESYDEEITVEDLITALKAFDYKIIEKKDAETHLHVLPKVK